MAEGTDIVFNERTDRIIWQQAGIKSARDTAKELGLKPEEVLRRRKELIEGVDDLTIKQAKQKLIADLQAIALKTQEDYENAPFEFKSGLMNSSIAAMKTVLVELNRTDSADQERINQLNSLRVKELLSLIDRTVFSTLAEIASTYDLDEDELQQIFQSHLRPAAASLDM